MLTYLVAEQVTWIRNPWWDGFWILSGLPVGIVLVFASPKVLLAFFTLVVLLETGHSFSPIVLAWSHPGFRRIMLDRPRKYILLPAAVFAVAAAVGAVTSLGWTSLTYGHGNLWRITDWSNPLPILVWSYWVWNIYHFGMQNFGVLQLYRRAQPSNPQQRLVDKYACLGVTAFGMAAVPAITSSATVGLLCLGVFSFSHWIQAIGLCSATSRWSWAFVAAVLALGSVGFVWMIPTSGGNLVRIVPVIICARYGLGFVHFLYDRWLWRLSDPLVGATIGRSLLARA